MSRHAPPHGERAMFVRYRASGDREIRDELVRRYLPLSRSVALRHQRGSEPSEDLDQVAALGLIKAVERFDPARPVAFSSFAVPTIGGEIKRYLRDRTWAIRPPRDLLEDALRVSRVADEHTARHGRRPTVDELATALGDGWDAERVLEALQAREGRSAQSLQAERGGDPDAPALEDLVGAADDGYDRVDARVTLRPMLRGVTAREREVLAMRFGQGLSQAEIGVAVGVSQMQVSRILRGVLHRLAETAQPAAAA